MLNYKETEKEHFTANKGWFRRWQSQHELINFPLSGEAASSDKDATVKFAHYSKNHRQSLLCTLEDYCVKTSQGLAVM